MCTECPIDTYLGPLDSPVSCIACPETSHTFTLASTSAAACLCGKDTFNDFGGVNGSFRCADAPKGGWAQEADYRLFTLNNFWRAGPDDTEFFAVRAQLCKPLSGCAARADLRALSILRPRSARRGCA